MFVPILNSDDHEQRGPLIGAALCGPQQIGWNTTTRGINLNGDYLNLEAPEMRATSSCCTRATQRCISTCMSAAGSIISTTSTLPLPAGALHALARDCGLVAAALHPGRQHRAASPGARTCDLPQPDRRRRAALRLALLAGRPTLFHRLRRLCRHSHRAGGKPSTEVLPAACA